MWRGVALALFLGPLLGGCAGGFGNFGLTETKRITLPDPPKQIAAALTPAQREHQRILAAYGGAYDDRKLTRMISGVVDRLVAASERPDVHYKVTVLNSAAVNAFALPNGNLYVTRGLVGLANDSAELASVLSHEMAHVTARHASIREDEAKKVALVEGVVNDVLTDPHSGALALAKSKLALAGFSRAQEFEADGIGVGIAARAGYDPYGAVRFLNEMGQNAGLKASRGSETRPADFLASHPATPDRIRNAQDAARRYAAGEREKATYAAAIDGLVYGEDPIEGYARGRRFLHPKLGFTFTAPEGFSLDNTAQAVLGVDDSGQRALRLDVVRPSAEGSLTEYLNSGWIDNIEPNSVSEANINGFAAATATAKGEQWWFRLYAVRFGGDVYRFIYATRTKSGDADAAFKESVGTFRRLSVSEIESAKPLRLKIVTVQPGDTVERLAGKMALLDRQTERFRVLNGLEANERLKPGDQVKLVIE